MDRNFSPGGNYATIRFEAQVWNLGHGSSVTFGRSEDRDIVLTGQVEDLLVSRHAGRLTAVDGGLMVTNESKRNPIYLRGVPGPQRKIDPQVTIGTMPFTRCRVVVFGHQAKPYVIEITCIAAEERSTRPKPGEPTTDRYWRLDMTQAQRRYLAALCEPMLTGSSTAPANYQEIADRCGVARGTVRKPLDALRLKVWAECRVPGLVHPADSGKKAGAVNFRPVLAEWAIRSGNATLEDLEDLDH
jgi:hypothetical protein